MQASLSESISRTLLIPLFRKVILMSGGSDTCREGGMQAKTDISREYAKIVCPTVDWDNVPEVTKCIMGKTSAELTHGNAKLKHPYWELMRRKSPGILALPKELLDHPKVKMLTPDFLDVVEHPLPDEEFRKKYNEWFKPYANLDVLMGVTKDEWAHFG
jgi:hypothetical protein